MNNSLMPGHIEMYKAFY